MTLYLVIAIVFMLALFMFYKSREPMVGDRLGMWIIVAIEGDMVELRNVSNTISVYVDKDRLTPDGYK